MNAARYVGNFCEWSCEGCGAVMQTHGPAPEGHLCPRCKTRADELSRLLGDVENLVCDLAFAAEQGDREAEEKVHNDLDAALKRLRDRMFAPRRAA